MADLGARQVGRQQLAPGAGLVLLVFLVLGQRHAQVGQLLAEFGQIRIQRLLQQAALLGAVGLALGGELQPLEDGVLVGGRLRSARYQQACAEAQDLPVPSAQAGDHAGQSGLGVGHDLHPDGERVCR